MGLRCLSHLTLASNRIEQISNLTDLPLKYLNLVCVWVCVGGEGALTFCMTVFSYMYIVIELTEQLIEPWYFWHLILSLLSSSSSSSSSPSSPPLPLLPPLLSVLLQSDNSIKVIENLETLTQLQVGFTAPFTNL